MQTFTMEYNRWPQKVWKWSSIERSRNRRRAVKDWNKGVREARERRRMREDE